MGVPARPSDDAAMVRSFSTERVDPDLVDRLLLDALRSPTAGNTGGTAWVPLEGPEQTASYWNATTDTAWRGANAERFAGLARAPGAPPSYTSGERYLERYLEVDKAASRLGR